MWLFWKKRINNNDISWYKKAIEMVNFYIAIFEWEKAEKWIEEIRTKEERSYFNIIDKLNNDEDNPLKPKEKEKEKLKKEYNKKLIELEKIKENYHKKYELYTNKQDKQRFWIRFKNIESEIQSLTTSWKNIEALNILNVFLEENKNKKIVIDFFNTQKESIKKNIEKQKIIEENRSKKNTILEAEKLVWINNFKIKIDENEIENTEEKKWFFSQIKEKINFIKKIKEIREEKKILNEINILIEENDKLKEDKINAKLENIHKWLIKELSVEKMLWYNFYGKILWADKISWDVFWFNESKDNYNFFIWDATWHWTRAWFIVTMLSKFFSDFAWKKDFKDFVFSINNSLKQDLLNRNFITSIFFEINKKELNNIQYIWMWHEPMILYKSSTKKAEKINAWWLAAWIRLIKNIDDIKIKELKLEDWDILITYSDWIVETKSEAWEYYSINRLLEKFENICKKWVSIKDIYSEIMLDLKYFKWWTAFLDDITLILLQRNSKRDIVSENSNYIRKLREEGKIEKKDIKNMHWKSKEEIDNEIRKKERQKKIKNIIAILENLHNIWETIKLKEEAIRFIKEWFIDPKINFYLKQAIENEQKYKIEQKQQRIQNKYKVLQELMKKWDYKTVVREVEDIIWKDWNI